MSQPVRMYRGRVREDSDTSEKERLDSERTLPPCPTDEEEDIGPPLPPDGGWGWIVVLGSLFCNIIVDGVCFSFGIFYPVFLDHYKESRGKTAIVGSLIPGMYLGMGPVSSALANKFGCRNVTMVGAVIAAISFFASTFSPNVDVLIFTYGICGGIGFGLMYLPAIVIVGFYFEKKRALATGLAVCGSGIGTFIFAPFGKLLLDNYGWQGGYWIISGIILNGVVCGALFRPLEATPIRIQQKLKEMELEELKAPKMGTIMNKIIEEKKRLRTISTGSLDGSVITKDNTLIKDPEKIKNIRNLVLPKLDKLEEVDEDCPSPSPLLNGDATKPDFLKNVAIMRLKNEDRSFRPPAPLPEAVEPPPPPSIDKKHENLAKIDSLDSGKDMVTSTRSLTGMFSPEQKGSEPRMRVRCSSESRRTRQEYRISRTGEKVLLTDDEEVKTKSKPPLKPIEVKAKAIARPLYRKDIFYTGSVTSLREYKSEKDMASYIQSCTSMPLSETQPSGGRFCAPLCSVLKEMLDFSLMKSPTFLMLCATSILAMAGFFTPFVYIADKAINMGVSPTNAALLLSVLGACNTAGRIICGWVSDQPWADCLLIHNVSLIIAGAATCLVPLIPAYWLLCVYCVIFGSCIAAFITLRSIVLVELLGLQKLTSSFGLLLLFQGIASLAGSPIAGAIYDATKSYTWSFIVSGAVIAISGMISLPIRRVAAWESRKWGPLNGVTRDYDYVRSIDVDEI